MEGWKAAPDALRHRCGEQPVCPGAIICPDCKAAIETANAAMTRQANSAADAQGA